MFGPLFQRLIVTVVDLLLVLLLIFPSQGGQGSACPAQIRPQCRPALTARRSRRHSSGAEHSAARSLGAPRPAGWMASVLALRPGWVGSRRCSVRHGSAGLGRAPAAGLRRAGGRRHGLKSRGRKRAGESHEPAPGQPARQRAAVCRLQPGPRWGGGAGPGRAVAAGRCGAVRAAGGGAGRRFGGSARSARAVRAGWGPGPWAGLPLRWRSGLRFQRPFVERRVNPPPFGSEEGSAASESWLGAAGREERSALSVFPPPASISSSGGPSRRCAALPPSEPRCWESNAANVAFSAPALPTYSQRCNFVSDLRSRAANHIRGQTQDAADGWPASERFSCFICPLWEKGEALSTKGVRVPPFAFAMYK